MTTLDASNEVSRLVLGHVGWGYRMLSGREQRILEEMEQRLVAEAPWLVDMFARPMRGRWTRAVARAYDVTAACAFLSAALCLTVSEPGAGLVAASFGYVFALRGTWFPLYRRRWSAFRQSRERAWE